MNTNKHKEQNKEQTKGSQEHTATNRQTETGQPSTSTITGTGRPSTQHTETGRPSTSRGSLHPRQTDHRHCDSRGRVKHPRHDEAIPEGNIAGPSGIAEERRNTERKKPHRNLPPLPALGEPGGRDDPRRRGLSGAGVRWYLRYLASGLSPDNARKKAEGRKKTGEDREDITTPLDPARKRARDSITPKEREEVKRRKHREPEGTPKAAGGSYAAALKGEKVAILPKEYPHVTLGAEDLKNIEEAIVEEVSQGWEIKLRFEGIHFRPSMIIIDCEDAATAGWLSARVPILEAWKGVALETKMGDNIPKPHAITVYLPRSSGQETKKSVALIDAQNGGLNTKEWKVLHCKDEGTCQKIIFGIDIASLRTLGEQGNSICYRFGKIPVHIHRTREQTAGEGGPSGEEEMQTEEAAKVAETEDLDLSLIDLERKEEAEAVGHTLQPPQTL